MPKFLNTTGNARLSVAICDRCAKKYPIDELFPDPNSPGLRVCKNDLDQFDPWRLAPRMTEKITIDNPRPDSDVAVVHNGILTEDGWNIILDDGTNLIQ